MRPGGCNRQRLERERQEAAVEREADTGEPYSEIGAASGESGNAAPPGSVTRNVHSVERTPTAGQSGEVARSFASTRGGVDGTGFSNDGWVC